MAARPSLGKAYIQIIGDVSRFSPNLRRQLLAAFGGVALGGIAAAATGKVLGLAGSLQQLAGAAVAVPLAAGVAAAGIGTLVVALSGFKDAIKSAFTGDMAKFNKALENLSPLARRVAQEIRRTVPQFKAMKFAAQDVFAGEILGQIEQTVDVLQGPLTTGLRDVSLAYGRAAKAALEFAREAASISALRDVFKVTAINISEVTSGFPALAAGFRDLIPAAVAPMIRLSVLMGQAEQRVGLLLQRFAASGQAAAALDAAVVVIQQLGRVTASTLIIVGQLFRIAASTQSGGLLEGLDRALMLIRQFVTSKEGVAALTNVFNALGEIAAGLAPVFLELLKIVGLVLGPELLGAIKVTVEALAVLVEGLGPAIAAMAPALAAGFSAFAKAIAAFGPQLPAIGEAFGSILGFLVPLLPILVPVALGLGVVAFAVSKLSGLVELIAALLPVLLPALVTLLTPLGDLAKLFDEVTSALTPITDALGPALQPILKTLGAVVSVVAEALGSLLGALAGPLGQILTALSTALAPLLAVLVPVVQKLLKAIEPLFPVLGAILEPVVQLVVALTPLIQIVADLLLIAVQLVAPLIQVAALFLQFLTIKAVVPLLQLVAEALTLILSPLQLLIPPLEAFSQFLEQTDWDGVGNAIGGAFAAGLEAVGDFFVGVGRFFADLPRRIGGLLARLPRLLADLFTKAFDAALVGIGQEIGLILFAVLKLPGLIVGALAALPGVLLDLFAQAWQGARELAQSALTFILEQATLLPGRIIGALIGLGPLLVELFTNALEAGRVAVVTSFERTIAFIQSIPGRLVALAVDFLNAGRRLITSFIDGFKNLGSFIGDVAGSIVGKIKGFLNHVIEKINQGIADIDDKLPGIGLPRIPLLAEGDIVRKPTVAGLAEDGAEAVIPLTKPRRARQLLDESGLSDLVGQGDAPVNVVVRVFVGTREIEDIARVEAERVLDDVGTSLDLGPRGAEV